jgi:tetratricopeptide (TPR) repeat protein
MDASYSTTTRQKCPQCNRSFDGELWLIVDTCERFDLVVQICDDTIHQLTCPTGHPIAVDAPLLVYDAVNDPVLIFSPLLQTSEAQDHQQADQLIQRLRNEISSEWDSTFARNVPFISRQRLREVLIRRFHNDNDQQITDAIGLLLRSMEAREQRRIIRSHPLLLTHNAVDLFRRLLTIIESHGNSTKIHRSRLELLEKCRVRGIDKAFAEQITNDNDPSVQIDFPAELSDDLNRFWEISARMRRDPSLLPERKQAIEHLLDRLLPDEYPQFRAGLLNDLGRCWMQCRTGDRQANLHQALAILQQGLTYATAESTPNEYGRLNQNMGAVYWDIQGEPRQQNLRHAAQCFSEALRVRTPEKSLSPHLKTLADLGDVHRALSDPSQATTYYMRMLETARQYQHAESEQSALAKLGYLAHEAGQLDQSLNYYRQAIAVPLQPTSSHTIIATILERQADIYRQKELTWHLFDSLARSLTLAQDRNETQRTARLSTQLWLNYRWIGQPHSPSTKPESDIMASLRVQARIEKLHEHGETASPDAALDWGEAGQGHYMVADSENSVTCFERMLKIGDALSDTWLLIHALIGLGRAQYQSGAGSRAIEHFEQALVLAREVQNEPAIALTLDYLAQLYREIGRLDLSGSAFLEAVDTARQFGRSKQQEEVLRDLELAVYQFARAMESAAAGHQPSPDVPDTIPVAIQADVRIANAQQSKDFGNWLSAALTLEDALHIATEGRTQEQHVEAAIALGRIYHETGAAAKAVPLLLEAHQIECEINDPPNIVPILIDLAHCYDFLQDWQRAAAAYTEALKSIDEDEDPAFACKVLFSLGWCYAKQQENILATGAYQQALGLSNAADDPDLKWSIQSELGIMAYRAGNYEEAFTWPHAALRTAEDAGLVQLSMKSIAKISYLFQSLDDMNQAITWGNHWLEYAQRQKDGGQYVRACLHLGEMYQRSGLLQ